MNDIENEINNMYEEIVENKKFIEKTQKNIKLPMNQQTIKSPLNQQAPLNPPEKPLVGAIPPSF